MPGAVIRCQYRTCHTIQPAPAAVHGLLTEHAFAAQADVPHDPSGGMVVGEAGGLDPAHLQALECDTQEGHGELGTQSLPLLAGVEPPAALSLLPAGPLGHLGSGPGLL